MGKWVIAALAFGAVGAAGYVLYWRKPQEAVLSKLAVRGDLTVSVSEDGSVVAVRKATLAFRISGAIAELTVREGDRIDKDRVLARLDDRELRAAIAQARANLLTARATLAKLKAGARPEEIDQARAEVRLAEFQVAEAEAREANAKVDRERYERLHEVGAMPPQEVERVRTNEQTAIQQTRAARERLAGARAALALLEAGTRKEDIAGADARVAESEAALEMAEARLAEATLASPITGVVTGRLAEPGEFVSPGQPVYCLVDPSEVEVELQIDQCDIGEARAGQKVLVTSDAFPDEEFAGTLREILPQAELKKKAGRVKMDEEDKVFIGKVRIDPASPKLLPGMKVGGRIVIQARKDALLIPREAVYTHDGVWHAWVVEDGVLCNRRIEKGVQDYYRTEVLSGLREGERVVTYRKRTFKEGMRVVAE